jgi:lipopolysaccharide transport system permease protein
MNKFNDQEWTTVFKPKGRWLNINLSELLHYKDLIGLFIRRDFVAIYKQTILGPMWFVVQPLVTTVVFTVIFGRVAKLSTEGVPQLLFYFSGNLMWSYFQSTLIKTSSTFDSNASVFGKVYFPRLTVPLSVLIVGFISFAIQFAVFIIMYAYYMFQGLVTPPGWDVLIIPVLLLYVALLSLGVGILVSSLTTRYRDLKYLLSFGTRLWMYATPIVYPLSMVPAEWRWVFILNPMTFVVETFRSVCFGVGGMNVGEIAIGAGIVVGILFAGILVFGRVERTFMDTV